jgi:hypothetical protein
VFRVYITIRVCCQKGRVPGSKGSPGHRMLPYVQSEVRCSMTSHSGGSFAAAAAAASNSSSPSASVPAAATQRKMEGGGYSGTMKKPFPKTCILSHNKIDYSRIYKLDVPRSPRRCVSLSVCLSVRLHVFLSACVPVPCI